MAKMLISSMVKEFGPQHYHNKYQSRLRQIIEAKINGREIVNAPAEPAESVMDIWEALQHSLKRSLKQVKGSTSPSPKRKPRKKGHLRERSV